MTEDEFTDAVNELVNRALEEGVDKDFVASELQGIVAGLNDE